jgi:penicillin-binding protein 1C
VGRASREALRRALLWTVVGAAVAGGLALTVLFGVAVMHARLAAPEPTLLLEDRHRTFLAELPDCPAGEFGYWPLAELPPRVVAATIALEDRRFWRHRGVDPLAVVRAFVQDARGGRRVSGASTLAMQVARMQDPGPRTFLRKTVEAASALLLTSRYGRRAVLAHYLRIAPYGNRIHGIAYAARRYLDKPVADLSWAEIAFLAAIPRAPARMNPYTVAGHARAIARGRRILALLRDQGVVSEVEYGLALDQLDGIAMPARQARPIVALHAILALEHRFADPAGRRRFAANPIVTTSLDLDLQERVAADTQRAVWAWDELGSGNAAVMVVDRASRQVLASVGSAGYFDTAHAGAFDYTRLRRSPGSTLKPFLYALALERGVITPATVLDDLARAPGGISDADNVFLGPLLPRMALANSRNVPAANLLARVGLDVGYDFFRGLGLHDGRVPARRLGLGMVVGGLPVTLERLLTAYTVLAGDGRLGDLVWFAGRPTPAPHRVLSETTAREVTLFLADPMARLPSFPRMGATEYPFPVAVKTGTSPEQRDAWTIAYSGRFLVGAWVGRADYRTMSELTGYTSAALLARRVLLALHRDQAQGLADLSFPAPRGYTLVRLCTLTGLRAGPGCEHVVEEWLPPGAVATRRCAAHLRLAVDQRNGRPATTRTPARFVNERSFVLLPARYAAWAAARGLLPPPTLATVGLDPRWSAAPRARLLAGRSPRVRLTSPEPGARLQRDPDTPAELASVSLQAVVEPAARSVVWYVDGSPYRVVSYPYSARWPLVPGEHTFQARVPYTDAASRLVRVIVR